MRTIAELNVLLRERIELPAGLKLATDEFHEGWNFMRTGDAQRLKEKIQTRGWNFIRIADESLRSGVGDTSQEAIASGLKLALRHVSTHFNAVEVEHIELTQYPWFFLARVSVYPYRIQQDAVLAVMEETVPMAITHRQRRLSPQAAELFPRFGSAMPLLKEMLVSSRNLEARTQ
ncbi:MAG: hypothetical protein ABSA48_13525 [Terracidiphilus sp.]|jgi:hypothetical protein